MRIGRRDFVAGAAALPLQSAGVFRSSWAAMAEGVWAGADWWTNPMQDWRVRQGRLECHVAGGDRNAYLLTQEITGARGLFELGVRLGRLDREEMEDGFVGFRVGVRGHFRDYRDSAVRGAGLNAGVMADGRLFIGEVEANAPRVPNLEEVKLTLSAAPAGDGYVLVLVANGAVLRREKTPGEWLTGGIALVCSSGKVEATPQEPEAMQPSGGAKRGTQRGGTLRFWFQDFSASGTKLEAQPERGFGPILWTMHTVSGGVLKLTAQMAPVSGRAELQVERNGSWQTVAMAGVDEMSRTAAFRVGEWDASREARYRVRFGEQSYAGTIRREPLDKAELTIGAMTCCNDFGFPHTDIVGHVAKHKPDILLFTGDQVYERVGEYGTQLEPAAAAMLDYLRKWYIFGWAWRDLLRDIPMVALPDDHDVFHGNVWGAGGRKAEKPVSATGAALTKGWQDSGGYKLDAAVVNAVQRTQTSHLPDPYDPAPVDQGIQVYYTALKYGRVSFAIVEDRKWKSAPRMTIPAARIENGWAQNPEYDARKHGDVKGAQLLGARQIAFLEKWGEDWSAGVSAKIVVSQTLLANLCTLPLPATSDDVTPGLPVQAVGEYPRGEVPVQDHDSNGWPQTARNQAILAMRRGLALHIGGDQHLGSTVQYGVERHNDGAWCLCTPAISNIWPRRWYPPEAGKNRKEGSPYYTGEFSDGFGNRITVHAVANPARFAAAPAPLQHRAPGYGIVKVNHEKQTITLSNWPRWVDPVAAGAKPYAGWPLTIRHVDNGLNGAGYRLDPVLVTSEADVVQVVKKDTGEVVYTVRMAAGEFTPPVFEAGRYVVRLRGERGVAREIESAAVIGR
jgi:hypothetical protein